MAVPDPIQEVITALAVLATPTATGPATPTALYGKIQTFTTLVFQATPDMLAASNAVNTALTDAVSVVTKIGSAMTGVTSLSDITGAMTALQNTLALAQSMAPAGTAVALNSASDLFGKLQDQLTAIAGAGGTVADATKELNDLGQLLTAIAALFPTS
jgi:hypothetical protein